ncbi:group II intron maturase-specific domain-containing protein [Candidatus Tisiphia endosymbiont of Ditula angustiorana]|uniref:group II intron maturase-specific domain-containing protein n=1 Tax=Candidatus Tisiphia endosymbiont of Ditula angustiorana TaxID=3066272 RepID=UPI00312C93C5
MCFEPHIRKYGQKQKFLTKPTKASVKAFLADIKATVRRNFGSKTEELIYLLNPKITGWTNYYRHSAASKIFSYIDNRIYKLLYRWTRKRHYNKGFRWIYQKYFQRQASSRRWHFHAKVNKNDKKNTTTFHLNLKLASDTKIRRHTKIFADAQPYDPSYFEYFQKREEYKRVSPIVYSSNRVYQGLINA